MIPFRRKGQGEHRRLFRLVEDSPLRRVDPRVKLCLGLLIASAVMLSLERLLVFWLAFMLLTVPARLLPEVLRQIRRIALVLVLLFVVDWLMVDRNFAFLITFRLMLVVSAFTLFFATTRPEEFRLALERLGMPYRYAFSLSLAFLSISVMDEEWRAIREAQRSRGAWMEARGLRGLWGQLNDLIALGVPAIVLTVKRAWTLTEAAYARGFDSPQRRPYRQLVMRPADWALLLGTVGVIITLFVLR
jgi:energy-coupling factor transport system permease protein